MRQAVRQAIRAAILAIAATQAGSAQAQEDPLAAAMAESPERFQAQVTDLIAGFGTARGLQADGIETHIALVRAGARATALRRFLAMDLDADGSVTRAELSAVQAASGAVGRGRLERQFTGADTTGDGRLAPDELAAAGEMAALRALDPGEAEVLRALMRLDGDGDGALTADEVTEALAMVPETET